MLGFIFLATLVGTAVSTTPTATCKETVPLHYNYSRYETTLMASTDKLAQQYFRQGLMLCFGFNHDEGIRSFKKAASLDATCSLCWWAIAYAYSPDINRAPDTAMRLREAQQASAKATSLYKAHGGPALNKALIDAIAIRVPMSRTVSNYEKYELAYAKAMDTASQKFPKNPDVLTFNTQAWMDTKPWNYYGPGGTQQLPWVPAAIEKITKAREIYPEHPFANHIFIHLMEVIDYNPYVGAVEVAGDTLRKIIPHDSPGIGHLSHMPSHAYLLTGRWHEGVTQNVLAISIDADYFKICGDQKRNDYNWYYKFLYYTHKHVFLMWCAGMTANLPMILKYGDALAVDGFLEDVAANIPAYQSNLPWVIQNLVRFGKWDQLLATPQPKTQFGFYKAFWHWSQGIAHLGKGSCKTARTEFSVMDTFLNNQTLVKEISGWGGNILFNLANITANARMAHTCEKDDILATEYWETAVTVQDAIPYNEPPLWHESLRPCLAMSLMNQQQYDDALAVFTADLLKRPHNCWALFGMVTAHIKQQPQIPGAAEEAIKAFQDAGCNYKSIENLGSVCPM
eukprot:TRINITY_DN67321_c3_g3_i1.p1 TRINITY_DN67321_c3_g3~~TRINITY_DN67321_c3_g3_i1.p1  ORF type:complete len:568 (+),score=65.52 TRINITY_DN67321_c3_g3_i1:103-1806(+)